MFGKFMSISVGIDVEHVSKSDLFNLALPDQYKLQIV